MKKISLQVFAGILTLILLSSSCRVLSRGSPSRMNDTPQGQSALPAPTASGLSAAALIPITGENVVLMQCQFCVGEETHAVLIFPDSAYFDVDSSSPASCLTADVVNGRRILICRGPQSISFNLSICSDPSNCLQFPVALQPCDLLKNSVTTFTPGYLAPIGKPNANEGGARVSPVPTAPQQVERTALPPPNRPPEPTKEPQPPKEPKPTHESKPTKEPKPTHESKPTHKPKPTKKA